MCPHTKASAPKLSQCRNRSTNSGVPCACWAAVERGSSVGRMPDATRNRESRVRIPVVTVSKFGHFLSLHDASVDSAKLLYLAIDSGGNVSE